MTANATADRLSAKAVRGAFLIGLAIAIAPVAWRLHETLSDARHIAREYIIAEAERLAEEISLRGEFDSIDDDLLAPYSGTHSAAYGFRILDENAATLAQFNGSEIGEASPAAAGSSIPPDFWWRGIGEGRFDIVGGVKRTLGGRRFWVEVMTHGDPDGYRFKVLVSEVVADVCKDLVPMLALTGLVLMVAARGGRRLSAATGSVGPFEGFALPRIARWPRQTARSANLVDRREGSKPKSSAADEHVARVSHDLRSRLAVVLLELNRIPDPRARVLENEVADMGRTLTSLMSAPGRKDANGAADMETIDLADVAKSVIARLEPLAETRRCGLSLISDRPAPLLGNREQIAEAIRNVVENAIKHGADDNRVMVTCGPGPVISIDDAGPGLGVDDPARLFEPHVRGATQSDGSGLGLAVVKAVIDLHRGSVEVDRSALGGTRFLLRFESIRAE